MHRSPYVLPFIELIVLAVPHEGTMHRAPTYDWAQVVAGRQHPKVGDCS